MRTFPFFFCIFVFSLSLTVVEAARSTKTDDYLDTNAKSSVGPFDNDGEITSDSVVEENPDYVPAEDESLGIDIDFSDYDSDDSSSDLNDDDDEEGDGGAKKKVSKKLKKTKKHSMKPFKLFKKNKLRITIILAMYAFRKEILMALLKSLQLVSSGDKPTDILKLILFVNTMRKIQSVLNSGGGVNLGILNSIGSIVDSNPAFLPPITQHFAFESLNEYYLKDGMALQKAMRSRHKGLKWRSSSTSSIGSKFPSFKSDNKNKTEPTKSTSDRMVVVLDWTKLSTQASWLNELSQEIAFLLSEYRSLVMREEQKTYLSKDNEDENPALEVVVLLESPGGAVSDYGLAGQHLLRLRNEPGITLTMCVDKVAASGGYMLCCTATPGKLFAAPFALLGSIGVIAQQINVNKLVNDWGVRQIEFKGGRYKAPIGLLGPVTKDGKRATQVMIDDIHQAFKDHVANARPVLKKKIEKIGDGSVWLGVDAVDLGLVDSIKTSDEYIEEIIGDGARVFKMVRVPRSGFIFGPRYGGLNSIDSKKSLKVDALTTAQEHAESLVEKSKTMMLHLPAQVNSLFSKSLK